MAVISLMTSLASVFEFPFDSSNFVLDSDGRGDIELASICVVIKRKWSFQSLLTTLGVVVITSGFINNRCC